VGQVHFWYYIHLVRKKHVVIHLPLTSLSADLFPKFFHRQILAVDWQLVTKNSILPQSRHYIYYSVKCMYSKIACSRTEWTATQDSDNQNSCYRYLFSDVKASLVCRQKDIYTAVATPNPPPSPAATNNKSSVSAEKADRGEAKLTIILLIRAGEKQINYARCGKLSKSPVTVVLPVNYILVGSWDWAYDNEHKSKINRNTEEWHITRFCRLLQNSQIDSLSFACAKTLGQKRRRNSASVDEPTCMQLDWSTGLYWNKTPIGYFHSFST